MCYLPVKVKVLDQRLLDESVGWGLPSYGSDTGAEIIVPPTKRVKFKVASALKASVVGETAE